MMLIAHAGHWVLGLLQFTPVIAVAAFALWRSHRTRHDGLAPRADPR